METCLRYNYGRELHKRQIIISCLDGQCVEYGTVPYEEFDVQSVSQVRAQVEPYEEEEEDAPAFANKTLTGDNFKKYAPFIILTIVFVIVMKCWCRRNTKIVRAFCDIRISSLRSKK